jgi:hypothetical protein
MAEHERQLVAIREAAAPYRRGKGRARDTPHQPAAPEDRIASNP